MSDRLSAPWGGVLTNRWGRMALALLAGAGAALAHPPFGILAGLLGYPLLMLLAERSRTARGGFWVGWLAGFAYFFRLLRRPPNLRCSRRRLQSRCRRSGDRNTLLDY